MRQILLPALTLAAAFPCTAEAQENSPEKTEQGESPAAGGVPEAPKASDDADADADTKIDRLSLTLGATLVTSYISRGLVFAAEASVQPSARLSVAVPELDTGPVSDVSFHLGTWNNIKIEPTPEGVDPDDFNRFYEDDVYAGIAFQLAEDWSVSATYYRYGSISGAFASYNDFELIVTYDDTKLWGDNPPLKNFKLSPSLRSVQEGSRPNRRDALYLQPSITPSFDVDLGTRSLHVAVPLMLGLSDHYYDGREGGTYTFGYFRTGVQFSGKPAPDTLPGLTLSAGADLWIPNTKVASGIDGHHFVGSIGISWTH